MKNVVLLATIIMAVSLIYFVLPEGSILKTIIFLLPDCIVLAIALIFISKILQD